MTPTVTVVGSGASGVHFALTVLKRGGRVRMLDVGIAGAPQPLPGVTLNELKAQLPDPADYFLGARFQGVFLPGDNDEYYGIPPGKDYIFESPEGFGHASEGFAPLFSFARGGLGEAWTAGCYPFTAAETTAFPFPYPDLGAQYDEIAARVGITGAEDDLSPYMPVHAHLLPPLRLDAHSARLLADYQRVRARLNAGGVFVGRTRVATLSQPFRDRQPCTYSGRCLWGCPTGALYTPSRTLRECQSHEGFEYVPGIEVGHVRLGHGNRVEAIVARRLDTGAEVEFAADRVALAAGALVSTRIFLATVQHAGGGRVRLAGLMDNRQLLVPFLNLKMLGQPFDPNTYQYHLLGMGVAGQSPADYVHGQITTLKTALVHPVLQRLPFDLATSTALFRVIHGALGLVNVNFADTRRSDSYVELTDDVRPRLAICYVPDAGEPQRIATALSRIKSALWALGCVVPPGMAHLRPMGASVHYAGTVPMTAASGAFTTTPQGESRDVPGLFLVDGAGFPALPAKNLTFTLMANAARIAAAAF
ncbi:MAG TPA: GMC oxidoreductase [Vicinamibacterales bacterium]|nr:GMC oxidoreductase [Vicinamibacterales bacterium]